MNHRVSDGNFKVPSPSGPRTFESPFIGDAFPYLYRQEYMQLAANWHPAILDSYGDVPGYYFVEESAPSHAGGGLLRWTRTYAAVPKTRNDYESFGWQAYGISIEEIPIAYSLKGGQPTEKDKEGNLTFETDIGLLAADHHLNVGDKILITYNVIQPAGASVIINRTAIKTVASKTPNTFTVTPITDEYPIQVYLSVTPIGLGRDMATRVVNSRLTYDYFLPGYSPAAYKSEDAIPILHPWIIFGDDGKETLTVSPTTQPITKAMYISSINNGEWIIAEASTLKRWKGNIFERVTRFVRAQ